MAKTTINISQAHTYGVSDEAAQELIEWRQSIKKPLTQRAFERALKEAVRCNVELGITADKAIEIAIDKGWQGVTFEYIKAELARRGEAGSGLVIAGQFQRFQNGNSIGHTQPAKLSRSDAAFAEYQRLYGEPGGDPFNTVYAEVDEVAQSDGSERVPRLGTGFGRPH